jgi:DNA (cytosine-5)-methyltransferase 1
MKKPIAVIDLYCGLGGFTQGAVEAGATVILSVDFWEEAVKVHKLNHPGIPCLQLKLGSPSDWKLIKQYIDKYPNYHIHLHGSPPCQALSNASSTDASNGMPLILHFLHLIEKLNPDSWSMENVVPMRKRLPEGTPSVVLNSADFGVPQTRRRCIAGEGWLANPSHSKEEWVSVIEALPHLENELITHLQGYSRTRPVMKNGKHTGVNTPRLPPDGCKTLDQPSFTVCAASMNLFKLEALGSNSKRNQDRSIIEPSKTICGSGNQVGARIFNHEEKPIKIRSLTIEETLTLQGFNPNFDLSIVKTQKSRWTLIGNAVCPPVAKAIIEGIE